MRFLIRFSVAALIAFSFCFLIGLVIFYKPSPQTVSTIRYENCNNCKIEPKEDKDFIATLRSDPTAAFTALLFVATVVLAAVTIGLYLEARNTGAKQVAAADKSATHAARSAKAAKKALVASDKSSERQLRAYVLIDTCTPEDVGALKRLKIETTIKNCGQTPAYSYDYWSNMAFDTYPHTCPFPLSSERKEGSGILGPGQEIITSNKLWKALTEEQFASLERGDGAVYFIGQIHYVDAFDKKRRTQFVLCCRNGGLGLTALSPYHEGNEAT